MSLPIEQKRFIFGAGELFAIPKTNSDGSVLTDADPIKFGVLQDVSVTFGAELVELYGQLQFPVSTARGKGSIKGTAKTATVDIQLWGSLFFGESCSNSAIAESIAATPTTIPATPFTITPTPPSGGTWLSDLGVRNSDGGTMDFVTGTPTTGQYKVVAGVYTFASADAGEAVYISFQYTKTSADSKLLLIRNRIMGTVPTFKLVLSTEFEGKILSLTLLRCSSSKLGLSTKQGGYAIPDFDFTASDDGDGNIGWFSTT